jgi:pyruvate-ferredoxin/flavodoxin oxidoreductase
MPVSRIVRLDIPERFAGSRREHDSARGWMAKRRKITVDGNEAAASVAYRTNEIIAIYPITPSAVMGELSEEWSVQKDANIWGGIPEVVEMQSEAGAIGAVHGALQTGALATTFTASQGLLLMIPSLFKIAGELTSFCMHVSARTVATHALSIFGDHSDVMACRQTGMAMLASGSPQEAQDMACIGQASTLEARTPLIHFFDGFRTSHQIDKIEELTDEDLHEMMDAGHIAAHRKRALTPDDPIIRGTSQNPDTFFQMQEGRNPYYQACPDIVQGVMDRFAQLTGRAYRLFDYAGHPEAERVIVTLGSSGETVEETAATRCPGQSRPSACWTAPRSMARSASRCIRTWSPRLPRPRRPGSGPATSRPSSAAATAFPRRNSPRPWSRRRSTSWPRTRRSRISPSGS